MVGLIKNEIAMIDIKEIEQMEAEQIPFPECVKRLKAMGIERYLVDLVRMEKTIYAKNDETYRAPLKIDNIPVVSNAFDEDKIVATLRLIQQDKIDYQTFIRSIIANGTCSYIAYLDGYKVVYQGRKGEFYSESMPSTW